MKSTLLVLMSSCLLADPMPVDLRMNALQNLKELELSLDMSSNVDAELLEKDLKKVESLAVQEGKQVIPSKCHQIFFLKEK